MCTCFQDGVIILRLKTNANHRMVPKPRGICELTHAAQLLNRLSPYCAIMACMCCENSVQACCHILVFCRPMPTGIGHASTCHQHTAA